MIDDDIVARLKAEHGDDLALVSIPETQWDDELEVVLRRPPRAEWKRFRSMLSDPTQKSDALETLARACVVHPEAKAFGELLKKRPGLAETIGNEAAEFGGVSAKATAKKV